MTILILHDSEAIYRVYTRCSTITVLIIMSMASIEWFYQDLFVLCHHLGRYPSVCYVYPILILFQYD